MNLLAQELSTIGLMIFLHLFVSQVCETYVVYLHFFFIFR